MNELASPLYPRVSRALNVVLLGAGLAAFMLASGCGSGLSPTGLLQSDSAPGDGSSTGTGTGTSDSPTSDGSDGEPATPGTATSLVQGEVVGRTGSAVLYVNTAKLDFGDALSRLTFVIANRGEGTLAYSVTSNVNWAWVAPASGSSTGGYDQVTVDVNRIALPVGDYAGVLRVQADDGQSQAVDVVMRVRLQAIPELELGTATLDFGPDAAQRTLTMRNVGGGSLAYTIESDSAWLHVGPATGELTAETDTINVVADRSEQNTGSYTGHLIVKSAGQELGRVSVSMEKPLTSTLLMPWIELPDGQPQIFTPTVEGLRLWRRVTNTAIVSTDPGHAFIYTDLHAQVPDMRIIPGIKTTIRLGSNSFDSVPGWQQIAADVAAVVATSGERTVIFEHESALNSYWDGTATIDFNKLQQGLAYLPGNVEYLWYPGLPWVATEKRDRALALAAAVQEVITVRFTDHSFGTPKWPTYQDWINARLLLEAQSHQPPIEMLWTYCCDGFCYWEPEQAPDMMAVLAGRPEVIVYPSGNEWSACATAMNAALWPPPPLP